PVPTGRPEAAHTAAVRPLPERGGVNVQPAAGLTQGEPALGIRDGRCGHVVQNIQESLSLPAETEGYADFLPVVRANRFGSLLGFRPIVFRGTPSGSSDRVMPNGARVTTARG